MLQSYPVCLIPKMAIFPAELAILPYLLAAVTKAISIY